MLQTLPALSLLPAVVDAALPGRRALDGLIAQVRQGSGPAADDAPGGKKEQTHLLLVYDTVCECVRVGDGIVRDEAVAVMQSIGHMLQLGAPLLAWRQHRDRV